MRAALAKSSPDGIRSRVGTRMSPPEGQFLSTNTPTGIPHHRMLTRSTPNHRWGSPPFGLQIRIHNHHPKAPRTTFHKCDE